MAERRSLGQDDLKEGVQVEESPAAEQTIEKAVLGFRCQNRDPADQYAVQKIAARIVEHGAPEPAHSRDFPALGTAACVNLVAARQDHHEHVSDLPADNSAHGIADQIFNVSKPVGARINAEQRSELARFIEQAQQKGVQDRALQIEFKIVTHVYAERYRQKNVEQKLPQRHACHVCPDVFYTECSFVPVEPDLPARDQIQMILPPVPNCRRPVRQRQADHEESDEHIQDKAVEDQGSEF